VDFGLPLVFVAGEISVNQIFFVIHAAPPKKEVPEVRKGLGTEKVKGPSGFKARGAGWFFEKQGNNFCSIIPLLLDAGMFLWCLFLKKYFVQKKSRFFGTLPGMARTGKALPRYRLIAFNKACPTLAFNRASF
jgi:hypothetical protein